jgi:hypothetical protein
MMRFLFIVLLIGVFLFLGCKKAEYDSNPPNPLVSVNTDSSIVLTDVYTLNGQSWVLYFYKVGDLGSMINHNDTLRFLSKSTYSFNKDTLTYSLIPTLSTFNLTLNGTFLGNLSGTIYEYNLNNGIIEGLKFHDITNGNNSSISYFVWMKKI